MISSVHFGLRACYIVIHILVAPFATTPEDDIAMTMGCSPAFAASVAAQLDTMSSALPMQGPHPGGARTSQEASGEPAESQATGPEARQGQESVRFGEQPDRGTTTQEGETCSSRGRAVRSFHAQIRPVASSLLPVLAGF